MRIGIVPTKYGYSAVALPPYAGKWVLHSPVELSNEMKLQLRGQILHRLAEFCHSMISFQGLLPVALPWALWGALALGFTTLWQMGVKYAILYGWIRFLFFGDGIWAFNRTVNQLPNLIRVWTIRRYAAKGEWDVQPVYQQTTVLMPLDESERAYIEMMQELYPDLVPYYKEMLRVQEPLVFTWWPLGLVGYITYLLMGPKIPKPRLIFELGVL